MCISFVQMHHSRFSHALLSILAILVFATSARAADDPPLKIAPFQKAVKTGTISDQRIEEASGIFASSRGILWVVNDGGNPPVLYALRPNGQFLKEYPIQGKIKNIDWEDLSGFQYGGERFLVIADVGDNRAQRKFSTLFFVKEPDSTTSGSLTPQWQLRFSYEDGPRDCEAMAVDTANKRILLLSKRKKQPTLYELPLTIHPPDILYTARSIGKIRTLPQPTASDLKDKYGKYRAQPTSMDISDDGRTLVILTYKNGYIFRRKENQTWENAFGSPPELIRLPHPNTGELVQREAICIDHQTGRLIVTSEQLPAPIYTVAPAD